MNIEDLEERVELLLAHVDALKKHIEFHEFDMARIEAEGLAHYCAGTNVMANKLADSLS